MVIALLLLLLAPAVQDPEEKKKPKPIEKGDIVLAKGCLDGSILESSDLSTREGEARFNEFVTYRLTGDKKLVKQIKDDHSGHLDVITAELRTDLPTSSLLSGRRIGNSRITVGVGAARGMGPERPPPIPVLRVTSFEHTGATCR